MLHISTKVVDFARFDFALGIIFVFMMFWIFNQNGVTKKIFILTYDVEIVYLFFKTETNSLHYYESRQTVILIMIHW